ncbi:hypothetical protein QQZ08_008988 [Neonectria magnoliae]|uniref:Peptidase A1 domain-containing protein n=1 Tax=Neonectria magnoliae TaxID=2732573 RepID=A0ABR1HSE0_9HYPO
MLPNTAFAFALMLGIAQAGPGLLPRRNGSKFSKAGRHDMMLTTGPGGFLSTIEIGTPSTKLPVFVDWTWISQFVVSPKCFGAYDPESCLHPDQTFWDPRESRTFKNLTSKYKDRIWKPNYFFLEDPLHAEYGADRVTIGPVSSEATIQLSDMDFNISEYGYAFPFGGVFGLAPVYRGDGKDFQSPFYQQWSKGLWKSPMIGFVYCYDDSKKHVCDGHDGVQSVGGIRHDLIKNNKIWWYKHQLFPDVNDLNFVYDPPIYNYWGVELESLKIGDEVQPIKRTSKKSGKAAIFDHASSGRGTPLTENAYDRLVDLAHGVPVDLKTPPNNGKQSFYSVNCKEISTLPPIKYSFRGHKKEWVVTPENYVEKVDNNTCVLNVRTLVKDDEFMGNFGETFAKDKYITLDFQKMRIGISDVKW